MRNPHRTAAGLILVYEAWFAYSAVALAPRGPAGMGDPTVWDASSTGFRRDKSDSPNSQSHPKKIRENLCNPRNPRSKLFLRPASIPAMPAP